MSQPNPNPNTTNVTIYHRSCNNCPTSGFQTKPIYDLIYDNKNITITLSPAKNYTVTKFEIDGIDKSSDLKSNKYTINTLEKNTNITVEFGRAPITVTTSAGEGGSISPAGNTTVAYGGNFTANITADEDYEISGIYLDNNRFTNHVSELNNNQYTLTNLTTNRSINVTFQKKSFAINATAGEHGAVYGSNTANIHEDYILTVTPDAGWKPSALYLDGNKEENLVESLVESAGNYTYTLSNITSAHTFEVEFEKLVFDVTITTNEEEHLTITPEQTIQVRYEESGNVTIVPAEGWKIDNIARYETSAPEVKINLTSILAADGTLEIANVTADTTINVTVSRIELVINAKINDPTKAEPVSINATVLYGDDYTLNLTTPDESYALSNITDNDEQAEFTPEDTSYVLSNVTTNHTIEATFAKKTFEINIYLSEDTDPDTVAITPEEAEIVYGEDTNITISAKPGYFIRSLGAENVDGEINITEIFNDGVLALTNVTSDTDIYVSVAAEDYTVLEGEDQEFEAGKSDKLIIRFSGDYFLFRKLIIDNKEVPEKYYTVREGSTIVEVDPEYVLSQGGGEHEIAAVYDNGHVAKTTFTVSGITESPESGIFTHENSLKSTSIFTLLTSCAIVAFFFKKKHAARK